MRYMNILLNYGNVVLILDVWRLKLRLRLDSRPESLSQYSPLPAGLQVFEGTFVD